MSAIEDKIQSKLPLGGNIKNSEVEDISYNIKDLIESNPLISLKNTLNTSIKNTSIEDTYELKIIENTYELKIIENTYELQIIDGQSLIAITDIKTKKQLCVINLQEKYDNFEDYVNDLQTKVKSVTSFDLEFKNILELGQPENTSAKEQNNTLEPYSSSILANNMSLKDLLANTLNSNQLRKVNILRILTDQPFLINNSIFKKELLLLNDDETIKKRISEIILQQLNNFDINKREILDFSGLNIAKDKAFITSMINVAITSEEINKILTYTDESLKQDTEILNLINQKNDQINNPKIEETALEVANIPPEEFKKLFLKEFAGTELVKDKELEKIMENYSKFYLKVLDNPFTFERQDMPVIQNKHLENFQKYLLNNDKYKDIKPYLEEERFDIKQDKLIDYEKTKVKHLIPVQKQIFIEKIFDNIRATLAEHKKDIIEHLEDKFKHTVIINNESNYIIDGHHRYATMMVLDPDFKFTTYSINMPIKDILKIGLDYNKENNIAPGTAPKRKM